MPNVRGWRNSDGTLFAKCVCTGLSSICSLEGQRCGQSCMWGTAYYLFYVLITKILRTQYCTNVHTGRSVLR